jgi:hypothetical protein
MTLAQAPVGLRAAVRRTLGPSAVSSGVFQQAELTASDGGAPPDQFGDSVAIYGSTAVVSAPFKGAVYVFVRSGGAWSQQAELTGDFGFPVAIYGSTVVIGGADPNTGAGAAYVFVRSGSGWSQQAELTASDAAPFGAVAISGSTIVAGASEQNSSTGAAYVFVRSGSVWSQQAELTASDGAPYYEFGFSVAIDGSTAMIGAPNANSSVGAAYVFVQSGTTWSQQAELNDRFAGSFLKSSASRWRSRARPRSSARTVNGAPGRRTCSSNRARPGRSRPS